MVFVFLYHIYEYYKVHLQFTLLPAMVLILDGNSKHVCTHVRKQVFSDKKTPICECSRSNQMLLTGQITEINLYVRTHTWATIECKYHTSSLEMWLLWSQIEANQCFCILFARAEWKKIYAKKIIWIKQMNFYAKKVFE